MIKNVVVHGQPFRLYSWDGNLWSSSKADLPLFAIRIQDGSKGYVPTTMAKRRIDLLSDLDPDSATSLHLPKQMHPTKKG